MINLDTLEIEIVNTEPIDGGVQVFARAWSDGVQIGFGKDGTVDIERFRIFNPPVLIDDPKGDIVQEWQDKEGIIYTRTLLEDPEQALLQSLSNIISSMQTVSLEGNIEVGKIGNTTTTVYPSADRNITSGSPTLNRDLNPMYVQRNTGDSYRGVFALTLPADPGSQQIDSVSFSVIHQGQSGTHTTVELVEITQATFDITTCTWNIYKTATNWTTAGGDFGAVIDTQTPTTGTNTWVVTGAGADNPLTLAWGQALNLLLKYTNDISSPASNWWAIYAEEQTGTASDPFLTIEHTTSGGGGSTFVPQVSFIM